MASIDLGGAHQTGARRALNQELPLIPCIDFLLCLIAFLLVTAVWSRMARLDAHARVPGMEQVDPRPRDRPDPRVLHVSLQGDRSFNLCWREGNTVYRSLDVERKAIPVSPTDFRYPALAEALTSEWQQHGRHRAPNDRVLDRAVLHAGNTTPFADLAAVLDALHGPKRELAVAPGEQIRASAFEVALAAD